MKLRSILLLLLLIASSHLLYAQWTLRQFPTGYNANLRVHNRSRDTVVAGGSPRNATIWSTNQGQTWWRGDYPSGATDTVSFVKHCGKDLALLGANDFNNFNLPSFYLFAKNFSNNTNGLPSYSRSLTNTADYMEDAYFFPHTNIGIMVGRPRGYVYRTTDAGQTWTQIFCPNYDRLVRVDFADNQTGYAVGPASQVMKSTNGGLSWSRLIVQGIGNNKSFNSVDFVTPLVGYIGASDGVYKTIDGGVSFTQIYSRRVVSVAFWTITHGFISAPNGTLLTTDGGQTWTRSTDAMRDFSCDKQGFCYGVNVSGVSFYDNPTPVSLEDTWTQEATFFPNPLPAGEKLTYFVSSIAGKYGVQVINSSGKVVYQTEDLPQGRGQLPLDLPSGLYVVQLQALGRKWSQKIIVL